MARYKVKGMNTGFGEKTYVIMMWDGERWTSSRPVRYVCFEWCKPWC